MFIVLTNWNSCRKDCYHSSVRPGLWTCPGQKMCLGLITVAKFSVGPWIFVWLWNNVLPKRRWICTTLYGLMPQKTTVPFKWRGQWPQLECHCQYCVVLFQAGISSGYQEKPCLDPGDPECPATAPNKLSGQVSRAKLNYAVTGIHRWGCK
jgi:hypothetical protein